MLDAAQFNNRRFLQLIVNRMAGVCLREVTSAGFNVQSAEAVRSSSYGIRINGRPELETAREDSARLFSEFVQVLRSSYVAFMPLTGKV